MKCICESSILSLHFERWVLMRKTIAISFTILFLLFSSVSANAEVLGGKWTYSPSYYISTSNSYYSNITTGASRWNTQLTAISANISIQLTSLINALVLINTNAYGSTGWNASATIGPNQHSGTYTYGTIKINTTYMNSFTSSKNSAICTHEWGHILGIDHTISNSEESLMYFQGSSVYYDEWGIYSPTQYDIDTLSTIY